MKFSKLRQLMLVSAIGLLMATLFSGCQLVTIDYLFVSTSASQIGKDPTACPAGEIETYAIDSESGAVRSGAPQVCSGGTTPIALAVSPGSQNLYVANQVDMNIVHFAIASNGVLTKKDSVTLPTAPVAMAVSADGNTLYVGLRNHHGNAFGLFPVFGRAGLPHQRGQPHYSGVRIRFRRTHKHHYSQKRECGLRHRI